MYRNVFCVALAMLFAVASGYCQTPQYQFSAFNSGPAGGGGSGGTELEYKQQSLYSSHDFPGMPEGWVKAIYLRVTSPYQVINPAGNCMLKQFTLKIGYTYDSVYRNAPQDSFRAGLTTIYGPDTFSVPCAQVAGGLWLKVPVMHNAFRFDHEHFFAVEVAWGPNDTGSSGYPQLGATSPRKDLLKRSGYVYYRNQTKPGPPYSTGITFGPGQYDLGFDLGGPAAGISELSNIRDAGLFPNPATDGRFNISLDAKQPMKEVTILVTDITGRQVLSRQYANPGNSFFEEINLKGAAKGMYFVRIAADGEVISRRVSIE